MNSAIPTAYSARSTEPRVSTLELFFDLVFVFTITQLTNFLLHEPTIAGFVQMVLLFGNVWWMYGGYAGIGYMIVTLVHTGLFLRAQQNIASAIARLGPFNLITAALLLVAGFTPGGFRILLFVVGGVLHWITPYLIHQSVFTIRADHFVERHRLILLIALGESVVAVGIGLGAIELPAGRIVAAMLGLALTAALWWLYFSGDDDRAQAALDAAQGEHKPWLALNAFGYAFVPILGGVVLIAAGLKLAVVRYNEPSTVAAAVFLAAGVAIYLAGLAIFRWLIHVRSIAIRLVMAVLALVTAFIGLRITPVAQLAVLVVVVIAGNIAEARVSPNR